MRGSTVEDAGFVKAITSPAAARTSDRILVIPVGSSEQHGPHLPLTTDSDIAVALAERLAALDSGVIVAPAISYGASGEHAGFPGTLSIGNDAIELILIELARSATATWSRILFISTHGGNAVSVRRAVARLRSEGRDVRAWVPRWEGDAHAGHTETSIMLAIASDLVDRDAATPGSCEPLPHIFDRLREHGVAAVSANGVLGDPTNANATHGHDLLEAATVELAEVVAAWGKSAS